MREFLSDECILMHEEYLRALRLKYSIFEKSISGIKGLSARELMRARLSPRDRRELISLRCCLDLHELFFSSFSSVAFARSELLARVGRSESDFLNELYRSAVKCECGFISVAVLGNAPVITASRDYEEHFRVAEPVLAIDLFEHAYFSDYPYAPEKYLYNALTYLNLSLLD